VFASQPLPPARDDAGVQRQQVIDAYAGGRWRLPELMAQVPGADEFYMGSISRATPDHYAKGRVALVGDAAYGNALGGFGTGLALVGAYVLAGELALCVRGPQATFVKHPSLRYPVVVPQGAGEIRSGQIHVGSAWQILDVVSVDSASLQFD
jgi:2-polyprenyl-6-methoxyphenol hydroxylase-like FAD-dependent oxidoreductase